MAKTKITSPPAPVRASISNDKPFVCSGIREDNPRDFLAALGLLRLLHESHPRNRVTLAWDDTGSPAIRADNSLPDDCFETLTKQLKEINERASHPFVHHKVIKVSLDSYRSATRESLDLRTHEFALAHLPAALYAAYASQVHDAETATANPSQFSFSNGQAGKELLRDIRELIQKEFSAPLLLANLKGQPDSLRDAKSFRWHPAEYRAAAYRAPDPGSNVKGDVILDYPCLNSLAFFGLTFYPVVDQLRRDFTTGFTRQATRVGSADQFTWPIWKASLDADELPSLLHHPTIHESPARVHSLQAMGCIRLWASRRFSADKSLYFAPATQLL